MDKKLTKEEFLEKLKTDKDFNNRYGRKHITEGKMVLPPCHYGFQVYTRELSFDERVEYFKKTYPGEWDEYELPKDNFSWYNIPKRAISLMWNQRSVDTFLGLPFNIASYGLLLEIIAKQVNMVPDELIGNLGDTHLYLNHIEQAKEQIGQPIFEESPTLYPNGPMNEGIKKQIVVGRTREPYPLPKLMICGDMRRTDGFTVPFDELDHSLIKLIDYQSHPTIKAPLSN
jgi:thymidylate synthase